MPVVRADLKIFRSQTFNDTATNGGRQSSPPIEVVSGVVGNVFQDAGEAERTAGSEKFRKVFFVNHETTGLKLFNATVFVENFTPGEDDIVFFPATTERDIQSDVTGVTDFFGAGTLDSAVSAGATSIDVAVHDGSLSYFRNGMLLRISDKTDIDDTGNVEEFIRVHPTTAITVLADVVTIPLETALLNGFGLSPETRVMGVFESGDLEPLLENLLVTSGSGTFNDTIVTFDNEGTIDQDWTITFTSATAFDVSGDEVGSVGSGTISGTFAPGNADFGGAPFFTIPVGSWGGTFATSDTVEFTTRGSQIPIWMKRLLPAGAASLAANKAIFVMDGESA